MSEIITEIPTYEKHLILLRYWIIDVRINSIWLASLACFCFCPRLGYLFVLFIFLRPGIAFKYRYHLPQMFCSSRKSPY